MTGVSFLCGSSVRTVGDAAARKRSRGRKTKQGDGGEGRGCSGEEKRLSGREKNEYSTYIIKDVNIVHRGVR